MNPLIELKNISKWHEKGRGKSPAVDQFSLIINRGEAIGLAGESGCGKTTVGKIVVGLSKPTQGEVYFKGKSLASLDRGEMKSLRKTVQIVLQDPYGSLNPKLNIEDIVFEGLRIHQINGEKDVKELMEAFSLPLSFLKRYPHELSGGQRQRINIIRALALRPEFVVFDESVSALDVTTQKQIIDILKRLKGEQQLTYLFISHDLAVLNALCDQICVMHRGVMVECDETNAVINTPKHPYTQALISASPYCALTK